MSNQESVNYTREVLMKMNDHQLNEMLGYLKNRIETGRRNGKNMQNDEVEFCYLQDEFFRRSRWNNRVRDRKPKPNWKNSGSQSRRSTEAVRPQRRNNNNR